jgi:hypothetical protein
VRDHLLLEELELGMASHPLQCLAGFPAQEDSQVPFQALEAEKAAALMIEVLVHPDEGLGIREMPQPRADLLRALEIPGLACLGMSPLEEGQRTRNVVAVQLEVDALEDVGRPRQIETVERGRPRERAR